MVLRYLKNSWFKFENKINAHLSKPKRDRRTNYFPWQIVVVFPENRCQYFVLIVTWTDCVYNPSVILLTLICRRGQLKETFFICWRIIFTGSKYPKQFLFSLHHKIAGPGFRVPWWSISQKMHHQRRDQCFYFQKINEITFWILSSIVVGGRQIEFFRLLGGLFSKHPRARLGILPVSLIKCSELVYSIFKNLKKQALLPTEMLACLYTIINSIYILFLKSSVLPSPRWTHSWHEKRLQPNTRIAKLKLKWSL